MKTLVYHDKNMGFNNTTKLLYSVHYNFRSLICFLFSLSFLKTSQIPDFGSTFPAAAFAFLCKKNILAYSIDLLVYCYAGIS